MRCYTLSWIHSMQNFFLQFQISFQQPVIKLAQVTVMMGTELNFKYSAAYLTDLSNLSGVTTDPIKYEGNHSSEIVRLIHLIVRPILIIGGTTGNVLTLYITRRPSLKNVSTCFYMLLLALADTSKWVLFSILNFKSPNNHKIPTWNLKMYILMEIELQTIK